MGRLTVADVRSQRTKGKYLDGHGLILMVVAPDQRYWVFRWRRDGRERTMSLGNADVIGLAEARQRHAEARAQVLRGADPLAERRAAREASQARCKAPTFGAAAVAYIEAHRAGWRGRGEGYWRQSLTDHAFPVFGETLVAKVTTADVLAALQPIWATKTVTAKILRNRIELVLDYAKGRGWREGENPARWRGNLKSLLPPPAKVHRTRHRQALPWSDAPVLMASLREIGSMTARALMFLMLTGVRSSEARGARWSEIDLDQKVWVIPADRMKGGGAEHRVPLSESALAVLAEVAEVRTGDIVFWGRAGEIDSCTLLVLLQRLAPGVTVHGMRSCFRDWCADHGQPADLAEMALAHTVGSAVERSYRRSDVLERRRTLMEQWARFLFPTEAVVVPIPVAA
jgi:integrase